MRIFDGIDEKGVAEMLRCFAASTRKYPAGATILNYSEELSSICTVLSGKVEIVSLDADGNVSVLETLGRDSVFGEMFSPPIEPLSFAAVAQTPCEILLIDHRRAVSICGRVCEHHSRLIQNLLHLSAETSQQLFKRISLLSQRSMRQKLLLFLEYTSAEMHCRQFELPMSLSALASYLAVDRSAMMRELARMREEGLIQSSGRSFELLEM